MSDIIQLDRVTVTGVRTPPSDDVTILIDGRTLAGWTDVRITRGVERLPSDFELRLTERYPGEVDAMIIKPGDPCEVSIGADIVITGYVDRVVPAFDQRQHSVTVSGRGKCQDLVDCAAEWPGGQITGSSVLEIARKLSAPYGIEVNAVDDPGAPIPTFNLMRGETPFEIIERLCRFRQLLAYDDEDGNLVLARSSTKRAASGFAQGVNVESATAMWSADQRFSEYRAYLQSVENLNDIGLGGDLLATYKDGGVRRNRVRIIVAESSGGGIGLDVVKDRAQWEASRRFGRSAAVRLVTDAWRDKAGALYTPNTLVPIDLPSLKCEGVSWVVSEVTYRKGEDGTRCDLLIMPPEAFLVQPTLLQPIPAELAQLPDGLGKR